MKPMRLAMVAVAVLWVLAATPEGSVAQGAVSIRFDTGSDGKGLAPGDVDPQFTWNRSGDYSQPRFVTRVFNRQGRSLWMGYERRTTCVMADGACWRNTYGPDVPPTMPAYDGVEYLYYSFRLPAGARDVELDVEGLAADDRVVLLVNGREIGGFSSRVTGPTTGRMQAGDGTVTTHTFKPASQYPLVNAPGLFTPGDLNVLTFWVNNTGSLDLAAPARPHLGDSDPSLLNAHGSITYQPATTTAEPTPPRVTATPRPDATGTSPPTEPTPASCVCDFVRAKVPASVVQDALANPERFHGWRLRLNPGGPAGPGNPLRTCLSIQNPNVPYHPVWNRPIWRVGCP